MLKNISLRLRLTIFVILLLTCSSIILTGIISYSAGKMATNIEASVALPAKEIPIPNEFIQFHPSDDYALSMTPIEDVKRSFRVESFLGLFLVIIGGGALTWYTSGKTLEPLKDLSLQIKNRTVHNLTSAIHVPPTKDELADLTLSFNEMTERISNAFESQKRFSASAAHELRTPLAVLQTKIDVFRKRTIHSVDEYENLINVVNVQTKRLSTLINDLLKMTSIENEQLNEEVDLSLEIHEVIEELQGVAVKNKITLNFNGTAPVIYGNRLLVQRAIYNLVENAIKYNIPYGNVEVRLCYLGNNVIVTVTDTGIGIPDEMKAHIFEPFFRVDKSRSRSLGGAGLGLSVVKTILDQNKGSIIVKDNKPRGTIFQVTFPNK